MRAYGMNSRRDSPCCCPGHDKFSLETYNNNRSKRAQTRDTKVLHRRGRRVDKLKLQKELNES